MSNATAYLHKKSFLHTFRSDKWWVEPLVVLLGLGAFVVYSTWAAFQGNHYWVDGGVSGFGGYLSPFYSPLLGIDTAAAGAAPIEHSWFGGVPAWWPSWIPFSPSWLILIFPLSFRFTCYYYRGAYYKSFAGSPPACAVGAIPQKKYMGETALLIFQNLHRYALYFAIALIPILYYDAVLAMFRGGEFGFGVGTLVLIINPTLLALYTFGCHSFRHLIGGRADCFSCDGSGSLRYSAYQKVTWMNRNHKNFAWASLIWVGLTDVYVRLVSMGIITDLNTWGV